ncbi:hypothetical protein TrVE_jg11135 [Triparma verrucosa]|uniref:Uncharacterized protein n=1 Tax=Triparma verrucosa TaxID=1606542 RepID=A0A9W6ZBG9_9STRA|nr:hypothetical protein TrVE_jg11135 [Triparma verrucosa]
MVVASSLSSPSPQCSPPADTAVGAGAPATYFIVYPPPGPLLPEVDPFYSKNYILVDEAAPDDPQRRAAILTDYCGSDNSTQQHVACTAAYDENWATRRRDEALLSRICSNVLHPLCDSSTVNILSLNSTDVHTTHFKFMTGSAHQLSRPYVFYDETSHVPTAMFYCMHMFEVIGERYVHDDMVKCRDHIVDYISTNFPHITPLAGSAGARRSKFYFKQYLASVLSASPSPSSPSCFLSSDGIPLSSSLGCLFLTHGTDKGWAHGYNRVYERILKEVKERNGARGVRLLEVGVFRGSSMKVWEEYFSQDRSRFYGLSYGAETFYSPDVAESNEYVPEDPLNSKTTLFYGSQSEVTDLENIKSQLPRLDVIIDDGSHDPLDQRLTFEVLFDKLVDGGLYVIEDIETSYWNREGAELYSRTFKQPLGVGAAMNVVDLFLRAVHYAKHINGVFLGDSDNAVKEDWNNAVNSWIETVDDVASVEFAYNMIIVRKKTEVDAFFAQKNREYFHKRQTK